MRFITGLLIVLIFIYTLPRITSYNVCYTKLLREGLFQFKNSLGHVGVVKKRRGKKEAFDTWKRQLESLLVKHIPECEVEFDEAWRKLGVESATGKT